MMSGDMDMDLEPPGRARPRSHGNLEEMINDEMDLESSGRVRPGSPRGNLEDMRSEEEDSDSDSDEILANSEIFVECATTEASARAMRHSVSSLEEYPMAPAESELVANEESSLVHVAAPAELEVVADVVKAEEPSLSHVANVEKVA